MAMTVQNDTGMVQNANSYVFSFDFSNYHETRGRDLSDYSEQQIEAALVKAADYIDRTYGMRFVGGMKSMEQGTHWPRTQAYDAHGNNVSDSIPTVLKHTQIELAFIALTTELETVNSERMVKSKTVKADVITSQIEYVDPFYEPASRFPVAEKLLECLLRAGGSNVVFVRRA